MAHLTLDATRQDVENFLKDIFHGTDADITDQHVDGVLQAHQANASWRQSLPIDEQIRLQNAPAATAPGDLTKDNAPAGVTVVDPGKINTDQSTSTPGNPQE